MRLIYEPPMMRLIQKLMREEIHVFSGRWFGAQLVDFEAKFDSVYNYDNNVIHNQTIKKKGNKK